MVYALILLIFGGIICAALEALPAGARRDTAARWIVLLSVASALAISLFFEGFTEGGSREVTGANIATYIGAPIFASDALATGLGTWTLAIGLLGLLKMGPSASERNAPTRMAAGIGLIAVLYSLAFTVDLRAFAVQIILLALLIWAVAGGGKPDWYARQKIAATLGVLLLLAAILLIGRTTGGQYNLGDMSLAALTIWPLGLIVGWAALWLGLSPLTGWSALTGDENGAIVHGLAVGAPVVLLILRLQGLVTKGALTGSTPDQWAGTMSALCILGGLTAVVGGAGILMWSGTPRWSAALTAHWMGLIAWSLGLDSPVGRWAALALFAAYGLARLTLEIANHEPGKADPSGYVWVTRTLAGAAMSSAPLTVGFVGVWLLGAGLLSTGRPTLAILLVGAAILGACGTALHLAQSATHESAPDTITNKRYRAWLDVIGWVLAAVILLGGVLPGLWLPYAETIAGVAGIGQSLDLPWSGIARGDLMLPLTMLGVGLLVLMAAGRLVRASATSQDTGAGALLPTALDRLEGGAHAANKKQEEPTLHPAPPAFIWWLSLGWLERGIFEAGAVLLRLGIAIGRLAERLEGRYFLPLAVLLALLTLLTITR